MISIDTETTGVDFHHGALPFFVTTCNEEDEHDNFEWEVDPYTRNVSIPSDDIEQIKHIVNSAKLLVFQNGKFDVTAFGFCDSWFRTNWPWKKSYDTIIAGHLLDSGNPHNLTDMVSQYLKENIQPFEDRIEAATQKARRIARRKFPDWLIAKEGLECMPSQKGSGKNKEDKAWYADMWLPRALVMEMGYDRISSELEDRDHKWDKLLAQYANADSYYTLQLWRVMEKLLKEQDLWELFIMRMKLPPIALKMEHKGITLSKKRLQELESVYEKETAKAEMICTNIASSYKDDGGLPFEIKLPKGGRNDKLVDLLFNRMKLPIIKETDSGNASLDKETIADYIESLPPRSPQLLFLQNLSAKKKRDTALNYMESYQRYWVQVPGMVNEKGEKLWYSLHPNLNITGTAHLRWSCNNPNEQNISKQEGFNLRYMFGPAEGREWWSLDAQNIELRIPTFEAGEKDLMDVFLRPKEAPYYGSYHLVVFDALYPELFKKHGKAVKDLFESTYYQWVKNGNFCLIYGAQKKKADATFHFDGAFERVRYRFPKIAKLSDKWIAIANRTGGVETIPDKHVNPRRGYPIKCSFGNYGKVRPTLPLNYHVSGTAMHWMGKGMIRCDEQLVEWLKNNFDAHLIMQVHDEMVFDLPKAGHPVTDVENSNLSRVKRLQELMQMGGDDINVPTPVAIEYNEFTWDKGIAV